MKKYLRWFAPLALVSMLLSGSISPAQTSQTPARLAGPIDEQARVVLQGNVSPVQPQYDRGEAPASDPLTHVRIVVKRSAEQQTELDRLEQELQSKSSTNYHKWLTPEEFGRRFGPADSDLAAIRGWLQSHGLAVEPISPGRTTIAFSGTVAQVEEAFGAPVHAFEIGGQRFYSNTSDPSIPAALAPLIQGIAHLNTRNPMPTSLAARPGRLNAASQHFEPAASSGGSYALTPAFTPPSGGSLFLVPGDAATIYNTPNPVFNANASSGAATFDGTGVTIGVVGTALLKAQTLQNYRSSFLGDTKATTITNLAGVTSTTGSSEPYLDLEIAGGLAPGAMLHYYLANDLNTPLDSALSENTVDILTFPYLECERAIATSDNAAINKFWEQAAAQGIAVTVSTGDTGSSACDDPTTNGLGTTTATRGLGVNAWASTPFDVAVGGTDFDQLQGSFSTYSTTGGDPKSFYRTVLKYIPEATLNDSTQVNSGIAFNQPWIAGQSSVAPNILAGGGGPSSCSANTTVAGTGPGTCTSGYAKPTWQRGTGVPADGVRDLPDVSMMSGVGLYGASWLVCDDANDCTPQPGGGFGYSAFGGTSTAAPAFAGILALVQQSTGGRLGQAATQLYNLYNGSHAAQIFHDVTMGSNSVSCKQGSSGCTKNPLGYYFESGYNAAAGYDLATGLGSVDATQLISLWGTASSGVAATVTVAATPASITTTQSVSVAVTVAGAANLLPPSGTVTLMGGGYTSPAGTLASGSFTFSIPANSLSVGTDTLQVAYSGDTNYASATGSAVVTVAAAVPPAFTLTATTPAAITAGTSATSAITVLGSNGYTGNVTLSCALTSSPAGAINLPTCNAAGPAVALSATTAMGTSSAVVNTTGPTAAAALKTPALGGSRWFGATGGSLFLALLIFFIPGGGRKWRQMLCACLLVASFGFAAVGCGSTSTTTNGGSGGGGGTPTPTPAKTTPTVTLTPASTSLVRNMPVAVAITVAGTPGTAPTGSVTLTSGSYTSPAAALAAGAATVTIPAGTLPAGSDTLTVSYPGDGNYNAATGTATLTVTNPPPIPGTTAGVYTFTVTGSGSDAAATMATTTFSVTVN